MLISKAKLAKVAGVSAAAITKACKSGKLVAAMCDDKIDTESEAARAYLRKKKIDPVEAFGELEIPELANNKTSFPDIAQSLNNSGIDIKDFEKMTLPEICDIFGTDEKFKIWTEARKRLTDIEKNEISNATAIGKLVSKQLIKQGLVEPIDSVFAVLLTDTAKTIGIRVSAMAKAGKSADEINQLVVDQISSVIKPAKAKIARTLRNA